MDAALRTKIGSRLTDNAPLMALLKNGSSSVYYGVSPRIDAQSSVPFLRFFSIGGVTDPGLIRPHGKVEFRLQVDVMARTLAECDAIAKLLPDVLTVPGEDSDPIQTSDWIVNRCWLTGMNSLESGIEVSGGGAFIQIVSTDWTLYALRKSQ